MSVGGKPIDSAQLEMLSARDICTRVGFIYDRGAKCVTIVIVSIAVACVDGASKYNITDETHG